MKSTLQAQEKSADSLDLEILDIWNKLGSIGCPLDMFLVTRSIWAGQLEEAEDHLRQALYNSKDPELVTQVASFLYTVLIRQRKTQESNAMEIAALVKIGGTGMKGSS